MKNTPVIIATIVVAAALVGVIVWYNQNMTSGVAAAPDGGAQTADTSGGVTATASGTIASITATQPNIMDTVKITDVTVGTGVEAKNGDKVSVLYTGSLDNGTVFDASSKHGNQPFEFTLGVGQVIKGWDQGVLGMKVGGKRELVIPASLGYGAAGAGGVIPPNATLHFTVQLLGVNGK